MIDSCSVMLYFVELLACCVGASLAAQARKIAHVEHGLTLMPDQLMPRAASDAQSLQHVRCVEARDNELSEVYYVI